MIEQEKVEMYLMGIEEINTLYEKYFNNRFANEIIFESGDDYAAYIKERVVEIPYIVSEKGSKEFLQSVDRQGGNVNTLNLEIWSVLHEVGHLETRQDIIVSTLLRKICNKVNSRKLKNLIYFNIPEEKKATKWAVKYAKTHKYSLMKLQEELTRQYKELAEKVLTNEE